MAGIPADLGGEAPALILAEERTEYLEDPTMVPPQRILPSCDTANGVAFPPRRMVEVAAGIEEGGGRRPAPYTRSSPGRVTRLAAPVPPR